MKTLLVIAGPTASGKTSLAIELAKALDAEIINADSRQFYRKMDIGTAKPSEQELNVVKHHFINTKDPTDYYSAGEFEKDVINFLNAYFRTKETAIMVGGSGLYLKAVIEGFDDLPNDPEIRQRLNARLNNDGIESLQSEMKVLDPTFANSEDFHNPQRLIRVLEVMQLTGNQWSKLKSETPKNRGFKTKAFYLNPKREDLYQRINERVDEMIQNGLEQEAKSLESLKHCNALKTVGYKELFDFFDQKLSRETAIAKIKQHTRNYAKRQVTWFKKQNGFIALESHPLPSILKHLNETKSV